MDYTATSTSFLQGVLNASPDAVTIYQAVRAHSGQLMDMRLSLLNERAAQVLGVVADEAVGRSYRELTNEIICPKQYVWLLEVADSGQPLEREISILLASGNRIWMRVSVRCFDEYVVVTYTDTTERKLVEKQQHDEHELLDNIFSNLYLGIAQYEAVRQDNQPTGAIVDFRVKRVNDVAVRQTGCRRENMVGELVSDVDPNHKSSGMFDHFVSVCTTGEPYKAEVHYEGLGGWFELSITKLADGVVFTANDITERKEAERRIQQQGRLLQGVIDNAPVGIILCEPIYGQGGQSGRIVDFQFQLTNKLNAQITGYSVEEMQGQPISNLFPDWETMSLFKAMVQVFETGEPLQYTEQYDRYGINSWFEYYYCRQDNAVLLLFLDVTQLKQAQLYEQQQAQTLRVVNRELARSNDSLQSFAYIASHDLQEPLRKIVSFGNLLQNDYGSALGEVGLTYIGRMQIAADRMSLLIKDLLMYSRLATHPVPYQPVVLNALLTEIVDDLDVTVREAEAAIVINELPTIVGDRLQIRQLFQNLLSNALKFRRVGEKPRITVSSRLVAAAELPRLSAELTEPFVHEITVQDNGIGFDEKYSERIFQVFERLHGKNQYSGTGVGLSITKRVAENHGGTITAEGKLGQGATFRVYLPK